VTPLRNLQQFEAFHSNPETFMREQAERLEKEKIKKAVKEKASEDYETLKAEERQKKPVILQNVLTRMQSRCFGGQINLFVTVPDDDSTSVEVEHK